jgi:hypothetical protein
MIIFDKPYVSEYLKETALQNQISVLDNDFSQDLKLNSDTQILSNEEVVNRFKTTPNARLYTNSENAIHWISKHLKDTALPEKINYFKDKTAFRRLTENLFPDVYFREVTPAELDALKIEDIPKPFVIKPAVGFFSLGVYPVRSNEEWPGVKNRLKTEIAEAIHIFPAEVLDNKAFIIEGYIPGTEFAFDAFYDENGNAVILNILKHVFASKDDVSDRVYITSKKIIEDYLPSFTSFLNDLGGLIDLKNFPLHVEVRVDENGVLRPIEVNPMRFGGFCSIPDLTGYAWDFNPYVAFIKNIKPDWNQLLKDKEGKLYGLVILDNSTGIRAELIRKFDYDKLLSTFEKPLELRKLDYHEYPLFGYLYTETREDNFEELMSILKSDLKEFVVQ